MNKLDELQNLLDQGLISPKEYAEMLLELEGDLPEVDPQSFIDARTIVAGQSAGEASILDMSTTVSNISVEAAPQSVEPLPLQLQSSIPTNVKGTGAVVAPTTPNVSDDPLKSAHDLLTQGIQKLAENFKENQPKQKRSFAKSLLLAIVFFFAFIIIMPWVWKSFVIPNTSPPVPDYIAEYQLEPSKWKGELSSLGSSISFIVSFTDINDGELKGELTYLLESQYGNDVTAQIEGSVDGNHVIFREVVLIDNPDNLTWNYTTTELWIKNDRFAGTGDDGIATVSGTRIKEVKPKEEEFQTKTIGSITIDKDRIVINEKIYFVTGSDKLQPQSNQLLTDLNQVLLDHPNILKIQIAGHTDNLGDAQSNKVLSKSRAESVQRFLVDHGVSEDRVVAKGFGDAYPIADNATAEGRELNRRVEFVILQRK